MFSFHSFHTPLHEKSRFQQHQGCPAGPPASVTGQAFTSRMKNEENSQMGHLIFATWGGNSEDAHSPAQLLNLRGQLFREL
jgi:hypothetical protein